MHASRILVTLAAMLILLAALALEIDRQSRAAHPDTSRSVGVAVAR